MSDQILYANGLDFDADLGCIPVSMTGLLGAPARTLSLLDIPGMPGAFDSGVAPREAVRTIEIKCLVKASSETTLYTTLDYAKSVLGNGLVELIGPYSSTRAFYGVLVSAEVSPFVETVLNGWATCVFRFVCPLPYAIATSPSVVALGSTATAIPLGTAPSRGRDTFSAIIEIVGAATTPTVTYKNSAGATIGTMIFTYSPAGGDSIVIDCGRRIVSRFIASTQSNAFSFVTADYTFPALDPTDGDWFTSAWPTLTVSSGTATITYYKMDR